MPSGTARLRSLAVVGAVAGFVVGTIAAGAADGAAGGQELAGPAGSIPALIMRGVSVVTPTDGSLTGIACPGASGCLAVGSSGEAGSAAPVVERWTGGSFTLAPRPSAPGAVLSGISCRSSTSCVAVGAEERSESGSGGTFAASYDGRDWTIQQTPSPPTPTGDSLQGVACPTTASCWAVGYVNGATPQVGVLFEHWNGRAWSVAPASAPRESMLYAVSCLSAVNCWAVGESHAANPPFAQLAEHWNGKSWAPVAVPGSKGILQAVTCAATIGCWATGTTNGLDLVLHLVGGAWRRVATAPVDSRFSGIACPAADECVAVGEGYLAGTRGEFADGGAFWNGKVWASVTDATTANQADFVAVACPSPTECVAVGSNDEPGSADRVIAATIRVS